MRALFLPFLAVLPVVACADRATEPEVPADTTAAQVAINPPAFHMLVGGRMRLVVTPLDADGTPLSPVVSAWRSSDPDVASVSALGIVEGLQPGSALITATSHGGTGTSEVTVDARSSCCGLSWTQELSEPQAWAPLTAVWGSTETDVFAVGTKMSIQQGWQVSQSVMLHYDGTGWSQMPGAGAGDPADVWGSSGDDVFAVGMGGEIAHYDGRTWTRMSSTRLTYLSAVWGSSGTDVYVVGADHFDFWLDGTFEVNGNGLVLHYDGRDWRPVKVPLAPPLRGVWGSSASDVFAVGEDNVILHYDGQSWSGMQVPSTGTWPEPTLLTVWGSSSTDVFAAGTGGTILHYDGQSWSIMSSPVGGDLTGVWGTSPTDVFAVGTNYTLLHYDGTGWIVTNEVEGAMSDVWAAGGSVFTVGHDMTILHGKR